MKLTQYSNYYFIFLSLLLLFFTISCSNKADLDSLCSEIDISIDLLEERISFTLNEINKSSEVISQRRYDRIKELTDVILTHFDGIKNNYINNKNYDTICIKLIENLIYLGENLDANNNMLDPSLLMQLDFCSNEIIGLIEISHNNCQSIGIQKITSVEENVIGLIYTILKTEKYLFNKVEILPIPFSEKNIIGKNDSLKIKIFQVAYDSTKQMNIVYWLDDTLKKSVNKVEIKGYPGFPIYFKGNPGIHYVNGEAEILENGRKVWKKWELEFEVK